MSFQIMSMIENIKLEKVELDPNIVYVRYHLLIHMLNQMVEEWLHYLLPIILKLN